MRKISLFGLCDFLNVHFDNFGKVIWMYIVHDWSVHFNAHSSTIVLMYSYSLFYYFYYFSVFLYLRLIIALFYFRTYFMNKQRFDLFSLCRP
jgi:predicted CDP-diglyceride synthetase/phosphatidate cytidylyltransferase